MKLKRNRFNIKLPNARSGMQVEYGLYNQNAAFGDTDGNISKPSLQVNRYLTAVPREQANLEAEGGETVYGDINGDGIPEHKIVKGPRHSSGGVPLNLPEDTFVYSDTRAMKIKNPNLLEAFGKTGKKSYTPADLAKQYDIDKYRKILQDPDSDLIDRRTAEMMIRNYNLKLGALALAQEAEKGFPQGIPAVAIPYMEANGIVEEDLIKPELKELNQQLESEISEMKSDEEEQLFADENIELAEEVNEGMPVATPEAGLFYGGGKVHSDGKIYRDGSEVMQQADPDMQILNEVTKMLQQGVNPIEVVGALLGSGIPAESIVGIFVKLGASEAEAVEAVEGAISQMQGQQAQQMQQAPMAAFGMSIGGFDVPFFRKGGSAEVYSNENFVPHMMYDPKTGKAYKAETYEDHARMDKMGYVHENPDKELPLAQEGIIIDRSTYEEGEAGDQEYIDAVKIAMRGGEDVYVINAAGEKRKASFKETPPTEVGDAQFGSDAGMWGDSDIGRAEAAKYYLLKTTFDDPDVRDQFYNTYGTTVLDKESYKTKSGNTSGAWKSRNRLNALTQDEVVDKFLQHQKRNMMLKSRNISSTLYDDAGNKLKNWNTFEKQHIGKSPILNPRTGEEIKTKEDFEDAQSYLKENNWNDFKSLSESLGTPLGDGFNISSEEATFRAYTKMVDDVPNYDAKLQQKLSGIRPYQQVGESDEPGQYANISPVDNVAGDTFMGQIAGVTSYDLEYGDPIEKEKKEKKCPCEYSDGTIKDVGVDPNTGECLPCTEDIAQTQVDVDEPAPWWLQDTINTMGAFGDLMGIKKYMPWAPKVDLEEPRPTFLDPTRELAASNEAANIQTQALGQFTGPQALSARSSSVQGQSAKAAADTLAKYNNQNIPIANQFSTLIADTRNKEQLLNQQIDQRLYDQTTVANQQYDDSKRKARKNLRDAYTNAITNRWKTDALNQMYPQYSVDPSVGGRMYFDEGKALNPNTANTAQAYSAAYQQCKDEMSSADEATLRACVSSKLGMLARTNQNITPQGAVLNQYPQQNIKKGGKVNGPGFVYANMVFPFIL